MLCITHNYTDPYFNLAAEEYMLRNFSDNCFMLWRNDNAIVVGKHQNTLEEINMDYVRGKKISVVRRISGGGTVFHDLGNLNFTFIMNVQDGNLVNFIKYTKPILEVLQKLSVNAMFQGKNNLTIDGKKFSGNAEHIHKKRVLHHGTLLFSSLMEDLDLAIKVNPLRYKSKAVQSIRSKVTNIKEHLQTDIDVIQFRDMILEHISDIFPDSETYEFSENDINGINKLREDKYITWEWNFGYSPKYVFEKTFLTNEGFIQVRMEVSEGIIRKIMLSGDVFNKIDAGVIEKLLVGTRHNETELLKKIKSVPLPDYLHNLTAKEFITGLF